MRFIFNYIRRYIEIFTREKYYYYCYYRLLLYQCSVIFYVPLEICGNG
jgi:hypothetical protein